MTTLRSRSIWRIPRAADRARPTPFGRRSTAMTGLTISASGRISRPSGATASRARRRQPARTTRSAANAEWASPPLAPHDRVRHHRLGGFLQRWGGFRQQLDQADVEQVVDRIDPEPGAGGAVPVVGALAHRHARRVRIGFNGAVFTDPDAAGVRIGEHRAVETVAEAGPDLLVADA